MLFPATKSELVKRNLDNIFRKHLYPNIVSLLNLEIFVQVRKSVNATGLAFVHIDLNVNRGGSGRNKNHSC